ncbi:hypothetical protein WI697_12400 [Tistrella mobilis]|uniref:DUF433 domain-containing protein n=1 Tax=Tistrella mobilis TaxID=171437 RepID=UPI0031F6673E
MGLMTQHEPLAAGFYTVNEAARLIEVGNRRRIAAWLKGYTGRDAGPLLMGEFASGGGTSELSFLDLIEVRFVEYLRARQVSARAIRRAIIAARRLFGEPKPFASRRILTTHDGRNVFVEEALRPAAQAERDHRLWDLITGQYEIVEIIERQIDRSLCFDPKTELANRWYPRRDAFPEVLIDPVIACGQPIVAGRVPTGTIRDLWRAEDGRTDIVASWFDIDIEDVTTAVAFEDYLDQPRDAG